MSPVLSKKPLYAPHPGIAMVQKWVKGLKEQTGKSLDEWLAFVRKNGPSDEAGRRDWLKKEHGLGTNSAWWVAERSFGRGLEDDDPELYLKAAEKYVEAMFAGKKAGLMPLYEELLSLCYALGKDVKVSPGKTIVSIYRNHVIAQVKPASITRIDFGLALGTTKITTKRLIDTGGLAKKDRITHRFAIEKLNDIDATVARWLSVAYKRDA
jgi:Domain of unknown function (DUF5655)/Domain of unknown function (DUF4287)